MPRSTRYLSLLLLGASAALALPRLGAGIWSRDNVDARDAALTAGATGSVGVTPHAFYSSSVGVIGCKVDVNRMAYWPASIDCNDICISLKYAGRSVKLLRVDSSQGAYDVSYDAWNYLVFGKSATKDPQVGGAIAMDYEVLEPSECKSLLHTSGHKLPLSASNSMNYLSNCLTEQPDSWVSKNYVLYNIQDPVCSFGYDETCTLDWPTQNTATCPHAVGYPNNLTASNKEDWVYDIEYGTGHLLLASTLQPVDGSGSGRSDPRSLNPSVLVFLIGLISYELMVSF
ncbi:hypothetical protein F5Y18DRAFT_421169 [Xylariaceae sp. FL1019]|nr:hypothetical protein F5Y18DRAFT_421169 [Xylariaceae sp. FL1019]